MADAPTTTTRRSRSSKSRGGGVVNTLVETVGLVVVAVVLAALIKAFFVQAFYVPSKSMLPTLSPDDRILVEKPSYWSGGPEQGDIVVFEDPGGWLPAPPPQSTVQKVMSTVGLLPTGGHLVKRVVAVGGQTVSCCAPSGKLLVDGTPYDEPYLAPRTKPSTLEFRVTVPEGRLWVMGDNRGDSEDSRYHQNQPGKGTIPADLVVGKTFVIVWPTDRWHWFGF